MIDILKPQIRNVLYGLIGWLVSRGYLDASLADAALAAALAVGTLFWQMYDRSRINSANEKSRKVAEAVATVTGKKLADLPTNKETLVAVVKQTIEKGAG